MSLYLKILPRNMPYTIQAGSSRKRRLRVQFDADAERKYTPGADLPMDEIAAHVLSLNDDSTPDKNLTENVNFFVSGAPIQQSVLPETAVSITPIPSSGPRFYVGGGGPQYEIFGVRVIGQSRVDGDPYLDIQEKVRDIYDLFVIDSWCREISA